MMLEGDESSSFAGSSESSSSTVWGPGALAGKFLKTVGEKGLDLVVAMIIRRRLAAAKQIARKSPHVLRSPSTPEEWQQMHAVYCDLKELCRDAYSPSVRKEAARLIQFIELLARPGPNISGNGYGPLSLDKTKRRADVVAAAGLTHGLWRELYLFPEQPASSLRGAAHHAVDEDDGGAIPSTPWNARVDNDDGEITFTAREQLLIDPLSDVYFMDSDMGKNYRVPETPS